MLLEYPAASAAIARHIAGSATGGRADKHAVQDVVQANNIIITSNYKSEFTALLRNFIECIFK